MTLALWEVLAISIQSVNPLPFLNEQLLICVRCRIPKEKIGLPEDCTVLPLKHRCRHDYPEGLLIPIQDNNVAFGGAFFTEQQGLPFELKVDIPVYSPHGPAQSVGRVRSAVYCKEEQAC